MELAAIISIEQNNIYAMTDCGELLHLSDRGSMHFDQIGYFHRRVTNIVQLHSEADYFVLVTNSDEFFVVCLRTGTLVSSSHRIV